MESKNCSMCNIGKISNIFTKNIKFVICYHDNKKKISNQRKIYYEKNGDKPISKQNERCTRFKELLRSYVELGNRVKTLEEIFSVNDSEKIKVFKNEVYSKQPKKTITP